MTITTPVFLFRLIGEANHPYRPSGLAKFQEKDNYQFPLAPHVKCQGSGVYFEHGNQQMTD